MSHIGMGMGVAGGEHSHPFGSDFFLSGKIIFMVDFVQTDEFKCSFIHSFTCSFSIILHDKLTTPPQPSIKM